MAKTFSTTVDDWVAKTKGAMENVFKQSVQDLIIDMQTLDDRGGNLPFDLGFLRSSLRITIGQPATGLIPREKDKASYTWAEENTYLLTINGAPQGTPIYAVYLANYAQHQEYGTKYMQGKHFRELAVQKWHQFVADNIAKAKAMQ